MRAILSGLTTLVLAGAALAQAPAPSPEAQARERLRLERKAFQDQEPTTAKPLTRIINPNDPPRIIWRDVDEVRRLGGDGSVHVRWFDAAANEADKPDKPGPWIAVVESKAPNGTVARRSMTFYVRPPMFLLFLFPPTSLAIAIPPFPGPIVEAVWREH